MMNDGWFWWQAFQGFFWIAFVIIVVAAIRHNHHHPMEQSRSAHRILDERYARGEISRDEYLERRATLQQSGDEQIAKR